MPIETIRKIEELGEGQKLTARFKGKEYHAEVVKQEDGKFIVRSNRKDYTSLSTAARAITGGAINGWAFWSRDEDYKAKATAKAEAKAEPKPARKPKAEAKPRAIRRVKNDAEQAPEDAPEADTAAEPFEEAS